MEEWASAEAGAPPNLNDVGECDDGSQRALRSSQRAKGTVWWEAPAWIGPQSRPDWGEGVYGERARCGCHVDCGSGPGGLHFMNRRPPEIAEFTEFVGVSPEVSAAWDPFLLQVVDQTPLQARASFSDLGLGVYLSGRHRIRRQIGRSVVEGWSDPGTINLTASGVEGTWEASASSRSAVVVIRSEFLSRAIEEHWGADASKIEIVNQFLVRDPVVETVVLNLTREVASDLPSGRLYTESGCEFLTHHIIHRYSSLSRAPPRSVGGLSSRRLKIVLDYIEDGLGRPIKLRDLANLSGVSARHFERAFRQSTGSSPHAYLMERRLRMARELLVQQPELPIEHIRIRLGFSSSSHFSSALRRRIGLTPRAFRKAWAR
jgi:AraC-like DNA-binding protein